jgi:hypothetical protein
MGFAATNNLERGSAESQGICALTLSENAGTSQTFSPAKLIQFGQTRVITASFMLLWQNFQRSRSSP